VVALLQPLASTGPSSTTSEHEVTTSLTPSDSR